MDLTDYVRDIPDFPTPGILFKDITPMLMNPEAFRCATDLIADRFAARPFDAIAGIESRGFLFATPLAYALGVPLIPMRKKGKLPFHTLSVTYALEYGSDTLEIHSDAISDGQKVLILDDLLATGGTAAAAAQLVERSGGSVSGIGVIIELAALRGRDALSGYHVESLITY